MLDLCHFYATLGSENHINYYVKLHAKYDPQLRIGPIQSFTNLLNSFKVEKMPKYVTRQERDLFEAAKHIHEFKCVSSRRKSPEY